MKKTLKTSILLFIIALLMNPSQSFAANLQTINYTEACLAIARGPLAALSYRNHEKKTGIAKTIHITTDLVRLANEILTIVNHPQDPHYSSYVWAFFDASNLYNDLFKEDKNLDTSLNLFQDQQKKINQLVQVTQTYLLPLAESATALYQAVNKNRSLRNSIYRQRAQAFKSLARATSTYLNHQKSRAAIVLLIGALAETVHALSLEVPPPPNIFVGQDGQQNQNQNNNNENFDWGAWLNFDNEEDNENDQENASEEFDADYWQNPERDLEEARRAQELIQQQQRDNLARMNLAAQAVFPPEIIRNANGELLVRRNGVIRVNPSVQDPIAMDEWEAGAQIRILACDHMILEEHVPRLPINQQTHCLLCRQPRIPAQERVVIAPE